MKRIAIYFSTLLIFFAMNSFAVSAASNEKVNPEKQQTTLTQDEADALVLRVHEISQVDISTLSKTERQELRSELLDIKKQFENEPVLIISGSFLILLLILLILL